VPDKKLPDSYSPDANILPYGSNLSAPPITLPDVKGFKQEFGLQASNRLSARYEEIKKQYEDLLNVAKDNQMIYSAKYNFVPKVGQTYHLYWTGEEYTLSLIENWKRFKYVGSFKFNADNIWERIDVTDIFSG